MLILSDLPSKLPFSFNWNNHTHVRLLFNTVKNTVPNTRTLDLSNNNLGNLKTFASTLWLALPHLTKLTLENNPKIDSWQALANLQRLKLTELVLTGTKLSKNKENVAKYQAKLKGLFPTLQQIDGVEMMEVSSSISETEPVKEHQPHFWDSDLTQKLVQNFISLYFPAFERCDLKELEHAYHPMAQMTIESYSAKHFQIPSRLRSLNRNLKPTFSHSNINEARLMARIRVGRQAVLQCIQNIFPQGQNSKHTFDSVQCWQTMIAGTEARLFLFLIGQWSVNDDNNRGFTCTYERTMVFQPGPGPLGLQITNDQLCAYDFNRVYNK